MTDLTFDNGNNIAGNSLIRFVPVVGIQALPTPATGGLTTAPTFQAGYRWFTCYGTEGTKNYQEQQSMDDNGSLWSITVSLFLPGDDQIRRRALADMTRHRFILEVEDNAGLMRRVGTMTETLEFNYTFGIDAQMGGRRGYTLSFKQSFTEAPPLLHY
ncbi:hypothetical protein G8759_19930 [Spirosoma aureum]|uniref:Phage tail protein n=1 Tax=Spirosoma aureum TaxID=2692134 RepID=A0A6G9AQF8_9BACT|nr:hypothetical protein [Spirosoma aureum]QIP14721.1 hypothetical protein G8759_19930 [Spirosoma aureum]